MGLHRWQVPALLPGLWAVFRPLDSVDVCLGPLGRRGVAQAVGGGTVWEISGPMGWAAVSLLPQLGLTVLECPPHPNSDWKEVTCSCITALSL